MEVFRISYENVPLYSVAIRKTSSYSCCQVRWFQQNSYKSLQQKKNCRQFSSVTSIKKYLQAAIFSSPLTDMLFCCNRLCCNRSRFHNKKTPDPGNKTGTRVYFPRCHPDCSEHPPNLLNSYKGLTLPTFIGSLESGTFSFLRRFAPTTGSL